MPNITGPGLLFSDNNFFQVLSIGIYVKNDCSVKKRLRSTQGYNLFELYWAHVPSAAYQAPVPIFKGFLPYMDLAAISVM